MEIPASWIVFRFKDKRRYSVMVTGQKPPVPVNTEECPAEQSAVGIRSVRKRQVVAPVPYEMGDAGEPRAGNPVRPQPESAAEMRPAGNEKRDPDSSRPKFRSRGPGPR